MSYATSRSLPPSRTLFASVLILSLLLGMLVVGSNSPAAAAVTPGDAITVGAGRLHVDGVDRVREADELIVYTPAHGSATGTNRWGAEAAVVDGVITEVRDQQTQRGRALRIPSSGVVLSGHGAARVLLLEHARVGVRVNLAPSEEPGALAPDAVRAGEATASVSGVDRSRWADELIMYTPARGETTATNQWGAEAVVVDGRVTALRDRQVDGGASLAIPRDGIVLSGHGEGRVFLIDHAQPGTSITLGSDLAALVPQPEPAPAPEPQPEPEPQPITSADAVTIGNTTRLVSGVDRERGTDELILFTPARGSTTGTNQWGVEIAVVGGVITAFEDRQVSGGPALAIPSDGVVLSGHGAARLFLLANAEVGSTVVFDQGQSGATPTPAPDPIPAPAPAPEPTPAPTTGGLPDRVVGGYWTYWGSPRLADVPVEYNTVYLFSARPVGGQPGSTGAVFFEQFVQTEASLVADIAALRGQGRAVILSVGGAGEYLNIGTRAREDAFVASIVSIYDRLGGFDGLDWNIESADLPVAHMVSASQRLKQRLGSEFAITTPPAPWRAAEMTFVSALRDAGVLDLVTPQYYDLTGLSTEAERRAHAVSNIGQWVIAAGGADKVGFGFRNVGPASETMTVDSAVQVWQEASARHPGLRGAMVWSIELDRGIGYRFAHDMARAIHD